MNQRLQLHLTHQLHGDQIRVTVDLGLVLIYI